MGHAHPDRPALRGFTCVRYGGKPPASIPHLLAARTARVSRRRPPSAVCLWLLGYLHQVPKGTCTLSRSSMPNAPRTRRRFASTGTGRPTKRRFDEWFLAANPDQRRDSGPLGLSPVESLVATLIRAMIGSVFQTCNSRRDARRREARWLPMRPFPGPKSLENAPELVVLTVPVRTKRHPSLKRTGARVDLTEDR